jgi:hypothetical protein
VANNMRSIGYQKMVAALIAFRNGEINSEDIL